MRRIAVGYDGEVVPLFLIIDAAKMDLAELAFFDVFLGLPIVGRASVLCAHLHDSFVFAHGLRLDLRVTLLELFFQFGNRHTGRLRDFAMS